MSKILRKSALIFGINAGLNQISQFGSLAAGVPAFSTDPDTIQSLTEYLEGWFSGIIGANSPTIEDMNALCYLFAYQIAYTMQAGIPEYNATTIYYIGSLVNSGGIIYSSLTDDNVGNALSDTANWKVMGARSRTVTATGNIAVSDDIIRANSASGAIIMTLPTIASSIGQKFTIKDVGDGSFTTSVKGNGAETIDGSNTYLSTLGQYDTITVYNNGTTWDVL